MTELENIKLCNLVGYAANFLLVSGFYYDDGAIDLEMYTEIMERFEIVKEAAIKLGLSRKDIENIMSYEV